MVTATIFGTNTFLTSDINSLTSLSAVENLGSALVLITLPILEGMPYMELEKEANDGTAGMKIELGYNRDTYKIKTQPIDFGTEYATIFNLQNILNMDYKFIAFSQNYYAQPLIHTAENVIDVVLTGLDNGYDTGVCLPIMEFSKRKAKQSTII